MMCSADGNSAQNGDAIMRIAVTLPDKLARKADKKAQSLGLSRSELVAEALSEYLTSNKAADDKSELSEEEIIIKLNEVYGKEPSEVPPDLMAAQMQVMRREIW